LRSSADVALLGQHRSNAKIALRTLFSGRFVRVKIAAVFIDRDARIGSDGIS
jgi:hypothetical protein